MVTIRKPSYVNTDNYSKCHVGKLSIGTAFLILTFFIVVFISATAAIVYFSVNKTVGDSVSPNSQAVAKAYASVIGNLIKYHLQSLESVVTDSELLASFSAGAEARKLQEDKIKRFYPNAYRVKLLTPGVGEPDMSTKPPLSEACLFLQQQAEQGRQPYVDIHGSPTVHIDMLRSVVDPQTAKQVGHVLVTLRLKTLRENLAQFVATGYAELQQIARGKVTILISVGKKEFKKYIPTSPERVAGTKWTVQYWSNPEGSPINKGNQLIFWGSFALVATLLLLIALILYKTLAGRLQKDATTIVNLFKDIEDRDLAESYVANLGDLKSTMEDLAKMAYEYVKKDDNVGEVRNDYVDKQAKAAINNQSKPLPVNPRPPMSPPPDSLQPLDKAETQVSVTKKQDNVPNNDLDEVLNFTMDSLQIDQETEKKTEIIPASIFRAYDIRGIVKNELTPELVCKIGKAVGSEARDRGQSSVVIARDGRLSGPELRDALSNGLQATGCQVIDIGQAPTPVLYYAAQLLSNGSGVVITGSHNPPEYNGLKIMLNGETFFGDLIQGLRERIEKQNFHSAQGSEKSVSIVEDYIDRICSDIKLERPLKLVIDCGNGVAGAVAPALFRKLGCEVNEMFCEVDGHFPNHHPDPSKPENVVDLCRVVKETKADLGLAFDGDGDRLGVVDSNGKLIWPDRVLMVLAEDVLSRNPGAEIIYDVKCTRNLHSIIKAAGGRPLMWKTGHSFIKAKIIETGALLAGEMSGHIFFKERWYGFDDALYAGARLLEVLSAQGQPSHGLFASLPDTYNTPELNVLMEEGEPRPFIDAFKKQADFGIAKLIDIDGLRVEFANGWGLVRASNTTPCLVLRFEADSKEILEEIKTLFKEQMLKVKADIQLPF